MIIPLPLCHQNDFITYQKFLNMKTQVILFLFSVLTLNVYATEVHSIAFANAKAIIIKSNDWKSKSVDVQIKEASGNIILSETLKIKNSDRKYNFKNLPDGEYSIQITDDLKIATQHFSIRKEEVKMSQSVETIHKPFITKKDYHLDINLMTGGNTAFINITDINNNIVYADKYETATIHKRFNITSLVPGSYSMTVSIKDRTFTHEFKN